MRIFVCLCLVLGYGILEAKAQESKVLTPFIEYGATVHTGDYTPLWQVSNWQGLGSIDNNTYLRGGVFYVDNWREWKVDAGLDLVLGTGMTSCVHQAYADFRYKWLGIFAGSKEMTGPLINPVLSSGELTWSGNARPIPQIMIGIPEYLYILPRLAIRGEISYGWFTDSNWQEGFAGNSRYFTKGTKYHSKSLLFRLGNREKLPLEFEFGLLMATQFGGDQYRKLEDGSSKLVTDMPDGLKSYWKAFFPTAGGEDAPEGEQVNVEGNHVGSWNFALNYYVGNWKFRAYLEHYFEDTSQMFWEYGRWKDGQLGLEITFPKNKWVTSAVWEGIATKDQAGPLLYDGFWGQFPEYQISANDDYYNHYIYGGWQYMGMGMGNPLISGPLYNDDHSISFRSNRIRANHLGISGNPSDEWSYRMLISFTRYWGTYLAPLDKQRKQFSSLYEATYSPKWAKGWSASLALGLDRGNYLGNSTGGMLTIKKTGTIF